MSGRPEKLSLLAESGLMGYIWPSLADAQKYSAETAGELAASGSSPGAQMGAVLRRLSALRLKAL